MLKKDKDLLKKFMEGTKPPAISFDGCHKIYILLDDEQVRQSEDWGYNEDGCSIVYLKTSTIDKMVLQLISWYDESCGLRFIDAVRTVDGNPNDGYSALIPQFNED
jgi:hypothetical protein